jgi:uncharacterized protein YebE (UPF0316 family)
MNLDQLMTEPWFAYGALPALIFCARIVDVSLDTLRVIYINKGIRLLAATLGFVQVLIWIIAVGTAMKYLNNVACLLAYATGFATGTYVGVLLENRLSIGRVIVRVITHQESDLLVRELAAANFGITSINGEGATGPVRVIFTVIDRADLSRMLGLVDKHQPGAFYTIEDVRTAHEGVFPTGRASAKAAALGESSGH